MAKMERMLASVRRGAEARKAGSEFEKEIERSFDPYRDAGLAWLDFLPVPMSPSNIKHPKGWGPLYVPSGVSPFDVFGWSALDGRVIAAELKSSKAIMSLAINLPELSPSSDGKGFTFKTRKGAGVKFHQLEALRNVVASGGIARILWNNEGRVMMLREEGIVNAYQRASTAFTIEQEGGTPTQGMKSIKLEQFEEVMYGQLVIDGHPTHNFLDWLGHC